MSFFVEFWQFLRARRKLWMVPLFVLLALSTGFVALTQATAMAPFIYALF